MKTKINPHVLIAAGLLLGVLILLVGAARGRMSADKGESGVTEEPSDARAARTWCAYLEGEAERLCESVDGVGKVTVVITLSEGFERLYASDVTVRDGAHASEYVTVGSGSAAHLCDVGVSMPKIAGIGVSFRGSPDEGKCAELTALLSAAFGVGTNKIYVTASK